MGSLLQMEVDPRPGEPGIDTTSLAGLLQRLCKSEEVIPLEECLFYDLWELNIVRAEGSIF